MSEAPSDTLVQHDVEAESEAGTRDAQAANLFDLRRIIGGLLLIYGVVLTIMGAMDGAAAVHKAGGIRINLWAGVRFRQAEPLPAADVVARLRP